jgi:4-hydroxybenzoate polyprenyltransferase
MYILERRFIMVASNIYEKIATFFRMIKFSHSIFALPFALTSAFIASRGIPSFEKFLWIILAMVSARTSAMALNRIIDRDIDKLNPRTATREIPSGKVSLRDALILVFISIVLFVFSAWMLNPLCFKLSFVALAFIFLYSYTKRFTWASHFFLGFTISAAPVGAWLAITGEFNSRILLLGLSVMFWIAGFDILYAIQDIEFDRSYGLYSIPARFGINKSLWFARLCHIITWLLLLLSGIVFHLNYFYYLGVAIAGLILFYEHQLVRPNDLSKLNMAFFNMNGYLSVEIFIFTALSFLI